MPENSFSVLKKNRNYEMPMKQKNKEEPSFGWHDGPVCCTNCLHMFLMKRKIAGVCSLKVWSHGQ